ncbi:hypothetical protein REPUB_Repub20aG0067500 [Reevesia pubescens]
MDCFTRHFSSLILFMLLVTWCDASIFDHVVHVGITNDIGKGLDLTVHCKSEDDDLGIQVNSIGSTFSLLPEIILNAVIVNGV